jgi:hypothetical protein
MVEINHVPGVLTDNVCLLDTFSFSLGPRPTVDGSLIAALRHSRVSSRSLNLDILVGIRC